MSKFFVLRDSILNCGKSQLVCKVDRFKNEPARLQSGLAAL